jgi:hypothetical protein
MQMDSVNLEVPTGQHKEMVKIPIKNSLEKRK